MKLKDKENYREWWREVANAEFQRRVKRALERQWARYPVRRAAASQAVT